MLGFCIDKIFVVFGLICQRSVDIPMSIKKHNTNTELKGKSKKGRSIKTLKIKRFQSTEQVTAVICAPLLQANNVLY